MKKIDTIEMVRTIRDKQNKDTSGKTPKEIIDYFRRKARVVDEQAKASELRGR